MRSGASRGVRRSADWGSVMLRRRIRSALYIDFENVPLPPDAIANWLAWLEDGVFDSPSRKRRFLQKRVYWNSHAERNRAIFERHGFAPILIGKYSGLKNGADIRMAMDVIETTYTRSEIDEFILLTGDSDFVPVLERLRLKAKRSAIVATEHRPNIHTTYHRRADILIPSRRLTEAAQYHRPSVSLFARIFARTHVKAAASPTVPRASSEGTVAMAARSVARRPNVGAGTDEKAADATPVLEAAAKQVLQLLVRQPRNYVAQKRVVAELEQVEGFKRQGPTAFFGTGSYKSLIRELTKIEPKITVVEQPGGGTGIVFIPQNGEAPSAAGLSSSVAPREPIMRLPMPARETEPKPGDVVADGSACSEPNMQPAETDASEPIKASQREIVASQGV